MISKKENIPDIVVARLPRYLRVLNILRKNRNVTNSKELGEYLGYSAAQIRKDLSQFGEFGKQGTGYNIGYLAEQIRSILNADREWKFILVGCGKIGRAMLQYTHYHEDGYNLAAAVDIDSELIGKKINDKIVIKSINDVEQIIKEEDIKIALLTVPGCVAQKVSEMLVEYGIRGILSYTPVILNLPPEIKVDYIDPVISLQHITYYLS